ncbi:MAG TPA: hypothetical protein VHW70_13370 [Edaphobacter sp.]|jgi:hypothetical protein|nr:hypothetical protein [Edaphobacter sp.]
MQVISIGQTALPHSRELYFAGAACEFETSSSELVRLLERLSTPANASRSGRFSMRVAVDELSSEPAGTPHFRGLHHVVIASFGSANVFVFDILRRRLSATVSGTLARDYRFWKEKLIPIAHGVLGAAMGLVPVHCACLESEGEGLLIAGMSGAGKSTLSVALAEGGFNYVSDDWTYISRHDDCLLAHGTSAPVKLLPDAVKHFQNLQEHSLQISMNGELAYEVDIADVFHAQVERNCEPRWLIFLERMQRRGGEFVPMSSAETRSYLDSCIERLPRQLSEAAAMREQTIESVALLPCWCLQYGGSPQFAANLLWEFVAERRAEVCA